VYRNCTDTIINTDDTLFYRFFTYDHLFYSTNLRIAKNAPIQKPALERVAASFEPNKQRAK